VTTAVRNTKKAKKPTAAAKNRAATTRGRLTRKKLRVATVAPPVRNLRSAYGLTRKTLSRITGLSERTLASWETGARINDTNQRAVNAAERLLEALADVVHKEAIAPWLEAPNGAFGGLKPVEVLERGEADRLWRMVYLLGSGSAS
jgi:DNA-binding transcriptional regulator YiaG